VIRYHDEKKLFFPVLKVKLKITKLKEELGEEMQEH
jgi:hypothetical protein